MATRRKKVSLSTPRGQSLRILRIYIQEANAALLHAEEWMSEVDDEDGEYADTIQSMVADTQDLLDELDSVISH